MTPVKTPPLIYDNMVLNFDPTRGYRGTINGIQDLSGKGKIITSSTSVTYNSTLPVSYIFNGSTSQLLYTASSDFNFGTGDITLSIWFYPTFIGTSGSGNCLIETAATGGLGGFVLFLDNANGGNNTNGRIGFFNGVTGTTTLASGIRISINKWYYAVFVRSGSSNFIYLSQPSQGMIQVATATNASSYGDNRLALGSRVTAAANQVFNGNMGQVLVYKGLGLTQAQVTQNFNNSRIIYGV